MPSRRMSVVNTLICVSALVASSSPEEGRVFCGRRPHIRLWTARRTRRIQRCAYARFCPRFLCIRRRRVTYYLFRRVKSAPAARGRRRARHARVFKERLHRTLSPRPPSPWAARTRPTRAAVQAPSTSALRRRRQQRVRSPGPRKTFISGVARRRRRPLAIARRLELKC